MPLPLDPYCVSDAAVIARAAEHGIRLDDPEQFAFLQRLDSVDMQAAPGCGKTTLIGLKLCLLAQGWEDWSRGVCVLSHTNVAKDQIVSLLENDEHGRRFLHYPHFVGTIQGFVDTFIALPFVRSTGVDLRHIDDTHYALAASSELRGAAYSTLRNLNEPRGRRTDIVPLVETAHFVWDGNSIVTRGIVNSLVKDFPFGPASNSALQYGSLKRTLAERGIYRYADMFAIGSQRLHLQPSLSDAIARRFPFLLIDEMQDTSPTQEEILNRAFASTDSVVQRVGDVNQRIYSGAGPIAGEHSSFPRPSYIGLPRSMRFGTAIAGIATKLTVESPQNIVGNDTRPNPSPTLILFCEDTIQQVLPEFGRLVIREVPQDDLKLFPVKAVGSRKTGNAREFPRKIHCYHTGYSPEQGKTSGPINLFEAITSSQAANGLAWDAVVARIWLAVCHMLREWGFRIHGRNATPWRLTRALGTAPPQHRSRVRKAVLQLLRVDRAEKADWDATVNELLASMAEAFSLPAVPASVQAYCAFPSGGQAPGNVTAEPCESFVFDDGDARLNIELASIHSVKGETHAATLILECYDDVHDLKEVLPILIDRHNEKRVAGTKSVPAAMRRTFVAMTRPRNLVAFAVRKIHIEALLSDFGDAGWQVVDLTGPD